MVTATFFEGTITVEVTKFDSIEDVLNTKVNDIGTTLAGILTKRQITMLKNGNVVRYNGNEGVKINNT